MRGTRRLAALAALLPATAAAQPLVQDDAMGTWTAVLENDYFFGSDDNYTNGIRIGYLSGTRHLDEKGRTVARDVLGFTAPESEMRVRRGFALAQEIYTPEDLQATGPLPGQHPYAGYLYGEFTTLIEQATRVDQVSIQLGVIGPSALGEEVQDFTHSINRGERARGWDNQIDDTPAINFSYDQQRRLFHSGYDGGFGWDCVPSFGFSFGTVKTAARTGLTFRVGENLISGYGPPRIRPVTAGSGFFTPQDRRSWYVFAGVQGQAVAYSTVLDGSPFRDDETGVESKVLVGDFQGGLAVQLGRSQLAFTYVLRSEEFEEQDSAQKFGALSLSTRF